MDSLATPAPEITTPTEKRTGHAKRPKAVTEIKELQRLLMADARANDKFGAIRAQIARAYRDLQDMRLRMAMKPAPKPIDVSQVHRKRRSTSQDGPVDPSQV